MGVIKSRTQRYSGNAYFSLNIMPLLIFAIGSSKNKSETIIKNVSAFISGDNFHYISLL